MYGRSTSSETGRYEQTEQGTQAVLVAGCAGGCAFGVDSADNKVWVVVLGLSGQRERQLGVMGEFGCIYCLV